MVSLQNIPAEKEIARLWHGQLFDKNELATEDGQPLEIISPGWPNDDRGPDFKQAVIMLGRVMTRGDIEIHIKSSSWREHGHYMDAGYNRVILHVVLRHDTETDARLQNGMAIPTLVLNKKTRIPARRKPDLSTVPVLRCRRNAGDTRMEEFLEKSGEARFRIKAERFRKELDLIEAGQCLYQGIMEALGYSRNKTPFLELAKRLPLNVLEQTEIDSPEPDLLNRWQALFLETSGLLPYRSDLSAPISPDDWHLMKVRPNNSPLTRLTAMSHLLLRYRQEGLTEGLSNLVRETSAGPDAHERLEDRLIVRIPGYPCGLTLLGRQRAAEIIINVLLPFIFAWSVRTAETGLSGKAFDIYKHYPGSGMNSVEKYMIGRLGISSRPVNSAIRRQGLIHIYKTLCSQGKCQSCELGQLESG